LAGAGPDRIEAALALAHRHADRGDALFQAGLVLAEQGAVGDAERVLRRATERSRADYRAYLALGRLLRATQPEEAARAWAQGLSVMAFDPQRSPALLAEGYDAFPIAPWWAAALEDAHISWQIDLARALVQQGEAGSALLLY